MSDPQHRIIAQWIIKKASNLEFEQISLVMFTVLKLYLQNKSEEEIYDVIELNRKAVINELRNISADSLDDGVRPNFEIYEDGDSAYIRMTDAPEVKLLNKLIEKTPEAFEVFCSKLLTKLGAKATPTGNRNDGGVDFTGSSLPIGISCGIAPTCSKVFVIGQAKRYADGNFVVETELRKFVGGAIRKAYDLKHQIHALTPILYAFWTTADFHPDAKEYARQMGMWYLNGIGLAQLAHVVGITAETIDEL